MSNEIRPVGTEGGEVLETQVDRAPADPAPADQKGIFDHLAEYLLQQPVPGASSPPVQASGVPADLEADPAPAQQPIAPEAEETEMRSQELVFPETAEKLVVEKEAFVREEVVLSKLVKEHVEEIKDRVKRTEVEVQRLLPEEAKAIAPPAPPKVVDAPPPPPSEPAPVAREAARSLSTPQPGPSNQRHAERSSSDSKAWWAWFALVVVAAVLIAFALGQFLGSAS